MNRRILWTIIVTAVISALVSFASSAFAFRLDLADELNDRPTKAETVEMVESNSAYLRDRALVMAQLAQLGSLTRDNRKELEELKNTVVRLGQIVADLAENNAQNFDHFREELKEVRQRLRAMESSKG